MKSTHLLLLASLALPPLAAQNDAAIKALAAQGPSAIPKLAEFLTSPIRESRFDAVHAIVEIGTENSLDPLIRATHDPDADMQVRATDGLVNFYVPGYYRDGFGATIRKTADSVRGRFTDTNTSLIAAGAKAREDVVRAAGRLIRMGATVPTQADLVCRHGASDGRVAGAPNHRGVPVGYDAKISHSRQ